MLNKLYIYILLNKLYIQLDITDEVGRCPIHRIYEYWREEELEFDVWGTPMHGAGTSGLHRGSDPKEIPRHGNSTYSKELMNSKPSPLKKLNDLPRSVLLIYYYYVFFFSFCKSETTLTTTLTIKTTKGGS